MSALPRPDLAAGPSRVLNDALHDLHHQAGWPSLRTLAKATAVSHTTVSKAFSRPAVPTWGTLELLVEVMAGDSAYFHDLWLTASAPADAAAGRGRRIAGRRSELADVRRHLESGAGLLLVAGEAGIGKTTLVTTAADGIDTLVVTGHGLPLSRQVPLLPIIDALRDVLRAEGGRRLAHARTACPEHVRDALAPLFPELGGAPDPRTGDEWARLRLLSGVRELVRTLAAEAPFAVVLEDLHWADPSTLDLVESLLSRDGLLVVGTWRTHDPQTEASSNDWLARVRRLPGTTVLELAAFTHEETAEQLSLLGVEAGRTDAIFERSRGLPLFTQELVAHPGPVVGLLADLLDARLGDVSGPAWAVARSVGVADRPLPLDVVADVAGLPPTDLSAALRELADRRLLLDRGGDLVALHHPLIAEAVRRRLVTGEAALVHRQLATLLGAREGADPAEVAQHWALAADRAHELGWRIRAAEEAYRRRAPREEASHWLRVLEIQDSEPEHARVSARVRAFKALELSGQFEMGLRVADDAMEHLDDLGDADADAGAVLEMAAAAEAMIRHDRPRALDLSTRAIERLETGGPSKTLVDAIKQRSWQAIYLDDPEMGMADARQALAVSVDLGDEGLAFECGVSLASHLGALGDLPEALAQISAARERVPEPTDPYREAFMAMVHSDILLCHRTVPPEEVATSTEDALRLGRQWDLHFIFLSSAAGNTVWSYLLAGETRAAVAQLGQHPPSDVPADWPLRSAAAAVAVADGRMDEAVEIATTLDASGEPLQAALWTALTHLWRGRPEVAWDLMLPTLEESLATPYGDWAWWAMVSLARAAADLGARGAHDPATRRVRASRLVALREGAVDDPLGPHQQPVEWSAAAALWDVELERAERRDTVDQWARVAMEWDALQAPHDAAYCRWRAAQAALRVGQGTVAVRLLKKAASEAREHVPLSEAIAATAASSRS